MRPTRRTLLAAALLAGGASPALAADAGAPDFAAIERASGGKLGACVLDTGTGRTLGWRAEQRFPFCSSFKALLAAMTLAKAERGDLRLDEALAYGRADLPSASPITTRNLPRGAMSIAELCAAAVEYSDNGAANLLFKRVGGPAALTAWVRSSGDHAFDLSHNETALNLSRFGDPIDTTTPLAMAQSYRRILFGDVLRPSSRTRLADWLVANTTGARRIRAGLPAGWRVGDKTGTWNEGWFSIVDTAVVWPPGRAPVVVAGFTTDVTDAAAGETALAELGRQVASWLIARG